ncbi:MAG: menaquinone biosynthetic enzyme MqnA/MqnD family protein [Thermodesulfovibrionales bacterium]
MRLRIGEIPYANLFPIFYMLRKEADCSGYEFIEGVPSELNRRLRMGEVDVSPSSSIEYLRERGRYTLIEGHSISSSGPVGSILLFSKRPIEALDGLTILTSSQSETSVALLTIILRKFYEIDCRLQTTSSPLEEALRSHEACLLIGDDALREAFQWPELLVYDLGDLWYKNTGLPSVFALWIARRELAAEHPELLDRLKKDLDRSKASALGQLDLIAAHSPLRHLLSEESLISYWRSISYDLSDTHRKGLELFGSYGRELGLF